eukprot:153644_1
MSTSPEKTEQPIAAERVQSASSPTDTEQKDEVELVTSNAEAGDNAGQATNEEETHHHIKDKMQQRLHDTTEKVDQFRDTHYSRAECCCFFIFLVVFTIMAVLARGISDVSFTQTITIRRSLIEKDEFVPWNTNGEKLFVDASTIEDIYRWIEQVAIPFLLKPPDYRVQGQQALLGGLRLKQIRSAAMDCPKKAFETCWDTEFDKTSVFFEDGNGYNTTYKYIDSAEILDQSWRGKFGQYSGGGFIETLPLNYDDALDTISLLRNISWMDGGTRFLAMDFNTFNPSTGLHTISRLAWEMPSGGVFPNDEIKTWKFDRYAGTDGSMLAAFHVLFIICVIGMTLMEVMACEKLGCGCGKNKGYWNSKWKALDTINLFIFYLSIVLYIKNEGDRSDLDIFSADEFVSFRQLQYGFTAESYATAINGLLLWIKLFKYLAVNKRLRFLFTMLGRSSTDILMFAIVLGVFVVAFGTAGFLTFNSDVDDFRSYVFSMSNMVRFTLVDMDYKALSLSSRMWGSLFYFCWSLLMLLILANVFIAILTEAYSQVQMELTDDDKIDLNFLGMGPAIAKIRETIAKTVTHQAYDEDGDGLVSAQELADQTGVSLKRAEEVVKQYDVDGDGLLDQTEFENLKEQIIKEQAEQEERQMAAQLQVQRSLGFEKQFSNDEFDELKEEVASIMELLTMVLDQTPAGKRALRQREQEKQKQTKAKKKKQERRTSD